MSSWNRTHLRKLFIQLLAILIIVVATGMMHTLPASSDPGDGGRWTWDAEHERRVFIPEEGRARSPWLSMVADAAPNGVTFPTIEADPQYEWVYGWDWTIGSTIHLCIASGGFAANPTIPAQCDLHYDSMVVYAPSWNPTYGMVDFDLIGSLDLQGGQYISMTDTLTTKEHQVTNLVVTDIDPDADTVSGTADPSSLVEVYEYDGGNWLYPIADGSGDWLASYSGIYDLQPGSDGSASQYDADSDLTWWYWEVPNPTIEAQPDYEAIKGWEWPEGETVHVCVDSIGFAVDPTNPTQCDLYHGTETVELPPGWSQTRVEFDLDGILDLQGGYYIAMTDGTTTKQHQVTNLVITGVDPDADTVSGTADPGSLVEVYEYDGGNWLFPIANGSGDWLASYSGIYDLRPGSGGFARQYDGDSDQTRWYWEVPNPTIEAQPDYEAIKGWEWPEGETVQVCVDSIGFAVDPTNPTQCDLYHGTETVELPPGWPITRVEFDLEGILDLQGGHYIAMTDGTTTKQHQVTNLDVTGVDPDTDIVSGTADPGTDVAVVISHPSYDRLDVIANGSGDWQADFSSMIDLVVGSSGYATQDDGDEDETWERWSIDLPDIIAYPHEEWIDGYNWPEGSTVHLCINAGSFSVDPTVPAQCSLYHDSMMAFIPPGESDWTLVDFDLGGIFDVQSGQYVSLSDGGTRKDLLVANLAVTGWDVAADTLTGTADPSADVDLYISDCSGCWQGVTADVSGDWVADFTGIADLQPGNSGGAYQYDSDEDMTYVFWEIPRYDLFLPLIMR